MRKIFFIASCLFILPIVLSLATPPVSITLSYDVDKGSLHVQAIHPTPDLEKGYVRLMIVSLNGEEVSTQNYARQSAYDKFTDDVPLTAQVGDVIKVELFCEGGGSLSQELTVMKPGEIQLDQSSTNTATDNTATDNASN